MIRLVESRMLISEACAHVHVSQEGGFVTIVGNGVYDTTEASRFTGLRPGRIREWFGGRSDRAPVFQSDYESAGNPLSMSFLDLVEVFAAGQFREHGVTLQFIRKVHLKYQKEWDTRHPFSMEDFRTDGKSIFIVQAQADGDQSVYDAMTKNLVFEKIILPVLSKIDYEHATKLAMRWHLADLVVLDPAVCFGKPSIEGLGITTRVISDSFYAHSQNARAVAKWYEIDEKHVLAAVSYESGTAA